MVLQPIQGPAVLQTFAAGAAPIRPIPPMFLLSSIYDENNCSKSNRWRNACN